MSWLSSLKSVFSPAQEVKEEEIQTVLQNYILPNSNHALKDRITQVNVQGNILQITINTFLPKPMIYNRFMMIWRLRLKHAVSKN